MQVRVKKLKQKIKLYFSISMSIIHSRESQTLLHIRITWADFDKS